VILVRPVLHQRKAERQGPHLLQQLFKGDHAVNGNTRRVGERGGDPRMGPRAGWLAMTIPTTAPLIRVAA
jgi:hypothetical protein